MPSFISRIKNLDIPLLIVTGLLVLVGLVLLYGTSKAGDNLSTFYRQLVFVGVGIIGFFFLAFYNYHNLAKLNRIIYPLLVAVLTFVLLFGRQIRGSSRWIDFGFFRFQPAEFAKLVIIIGLARWLYLKRGQINSWKSIALTFLYTAIPAILILREPDLGSTLILFAIWIGILLVSPMNKKYLVALVLLALVVSGVSWKFLLHDYQKRRVEVFLNPNLDPRGKGYNVRQALIAVGNGQVLGQGLGQGMQSQLKFLPERQTDFIFASASEEVGFVGSTALIVLYFYLFIRLIRIIRESRDDLALYIGSGVLFLLLVQVLINVGMNIGLMPVTGIPLPFLTAGGSSLIVVLFSLGIMQNIARQSKNSRF